MLLKDKQAIEALRKENYSYACIAFWIVLIVIRNTFAAMLVA